MPRNGQTQVLGIVSIVPMGEWEPTITYQKLNYVRHGGANYLAKGSSINVEPGEAENWEDLWMLTIYDGSNVTPYGTYPYMTVGTLLASELSEGSLNDYLVVDYSGKSFYAAAGNIVADKPDGVDAFSMTVSMAGDGTAMQVLWETDNNNLFVRDSAQTQWVQFARVDGAYPNMTVGTALSQIKVPFTIASSQWTDALTAILSSEQYPLLSNLQSGSFATVIFDEDSAIPVIQSNVAISSQAVGNITFSCTDKPAEALSGTIIIS